MISHHFPSFSRGPSNGEKNPGPTWALDLCWRLYLRRAEHFEGNRVGFREPMGDSTIKNGLRWESHGISWDLQAFLGLRPFYIEILGTCIHAGPKMVSCPPLNIPKLSNFDENEELSNLGWPNLMECIPKFGIYQPWYDIWVWKKAVRQFSETTWISCRCQASQPTHRCENGCRIDFSRGKWCAFCLVNVQLFSMVKRTEFLETWFVVVFFPWNVCSLLHDP